MHGAAAGLPADQRMQMQPYLARVSAASTNLRRVSAALARQSRGPAEVQQFPDSKR